MTLARVIATGRGRIGARLVIEGLEYVFVSAARMERTMADGRVCVNGLDLEDMVIGASADLMRAKLTGTSLTLRIKDLDRIAGKRHGRVTRALWRSRTLSAYLASDAAAADTTIDLGASGAALPSAGVVHIGTEAIAYTGVSAGSLTGCTRGHWQTIAQAHFVADGEGLSDALVTNQPIGVEGRRCYLYLYGDGDDPQGDGTLRWRGVCATDVRWSGGVCEIEADPITRILDQPLGGDLSSPVQSRGIHYTSASPWHMRIVNADTSQSARARLVGFWETQDEFCVDANTAIADAITDAGLTIGDGEIVLTPEVGGYRVTYRTDSVTASRMWVYIFSDIEYGADGVTPILDATTAWEASSDDGAPVVIGTGDWTPAVSETYSFLVVAPVPRGTLGHRETWHGGGEIPAGPEADYYRVYLGGTVVVAAGDVLRIGTGDTARFATVYSADAATRSCVIVDGIPGRFIRLDPYTEIALGRHLASGSFLDALDALVLSSPSLANAGAMPLLSGDDVTWESDVDAHVATSRVANGRGFYLFEGGATLAELLTPEMLASGVYPRLTATGRIELKRLTPPLPGASADWEIDDTAAFGAMIEKSPRGVLSQVLYRVGYDPLEDEWSESSIAFRDVQATSATRTPITLEIAQKSTETASWLASDLGLAIVDRDEVMRVAIQYLGLFGMPTAVVSLDTDARYMNALVGETVSLSSSILPDVEDGVSAMSDRVGLIVASACELATGRVSLGVLLHTQRFTGYAPGFPVASQTDNGGDEWDVDVTLSPYTDAATIATWLTAGDLVRVSQPSSYASAVDGTVVSIVDANTVRVQFDATWTPGTDDWILQPTLSANMNATAPLARYCYTADTSIQIEYLDGFVDAQVLA